MSRRPSGPDAARRRRSLRAGRIAEWAAAAWLMAKGHRLLAIRYAAAGGEVDLIVARGEMVAFVEVKARADMEATATAITAEKRRRFVGAARHWIAGRRLDGKVLRADAVLIAPWRWPRHVPNAFPLEPDGGW